VQRQTVKHNQTLDATAPVVWRENYGYRLDSGRLHTRTTSSQGGPLVPFTHTLYSGGAVHGREW